jgi:hypothetical protein
MLPPESVPPPCESAAHWGIWRFNASFDAVCRCSACESATGTKPQTLRSLRGTSGLNLLARYRACTALHSGYASFSLMCYASSALQTNESCMRVMRLHFSTWLLPLFSDRGKQRFNRTKSRRVRLPCIKISVPSALAVLQLSPSSSIRAGQPAAGLRLRSVLGRCWFAERSTWRLPSRKLQRPRRLP